MTSDTGVSPTPSHPKPAVAKTADIGAGKVFVPAATPGAAIVGLFAGIALIGLAVVAVRDPLVYLGWLDGAGWLHSAAQWLADIEWWEWMWPAAIALVVVGLWMLWVAVKPRRRTHISLVGYEVLWTRRGDVARRCSAVVGDLPGVENATTVVGRRRAKVTVTTHGNTVDRAEIARVVDAVLDGVEPHMTSKVRLVRRGGEDA